MRVGLITLGCDKNTVDNEYLAGMLEDRGCDVEFIDDIRAEQAYDAVVITTCGFIGDAKAQSVETIVDLTDRKRATGRPRRVFVAGCLAQRYADELLQEMPDVDGIVGVGQFQQLTELILDGADPALRSRVREVPTVEIEHLIRRKRSDGKPYAFLKISDGCNHGCTFCSIPLMKGRHKSVPAPVLMEEARRLIDDGVKELVLVAQDLAAYGRDEGEEYRLPRLLRELCALDGDFRVRCLYVYPAGITEEFLDVLAGEEKLVPYLDVPLQHLDPGVLRRMNRPSKDINTFKLVERIRERVPDIALRTTMIVGFPGETRPAHLNMLNGIREMRFNWLGAFQYSREEDTPAGVLEGQLSRATKERRWKAVMETQAEITAEINRGRIGTRARVLVEGYDEDREQWIGRSAHEAPEVDGIVWLESDKPLQVGQFVDATITDTDVYDVIAQPR
jgi:ribosomal protein S12 methylthiotransferase